MVDVEDMIVMEDEFGEERDESVSNMSFENADDGWGEEAGSPNQLLVPKALKKNVSLSSEDSWGDNGEMEEEVEALDGWGSNPGLARLGMEPTATENSDWGDLQHDEEIAGIGNTSDAPRVTSSIAAQAQADCREINFLNGIAGAHTKVEADDSAVTIALAIKVQALRLTNLQREIYALDIQEQILIKIKFDTYYLGGSRPTVVDVGKIPADASINYDTNPEEFLFSWTLKDRIQNSFIKGRAWPDDSIGDRPPKCIDSLIDMFKRPLADILILLQKYNGRESSVQEALLKDCTVTKVPIQEATETLINELENMSGHKISELPINENIVDLYYVMQHNYLAHIILYAAFAIHTGNRTCMICDGNLDYIGWKPRVCVKEQCQFQFNNLGLGFSLSHQIRHEQIIMDLYISTLLGCVNNMGHRIKLCFPDKVTAFTKDEKYQNFMRWVTPEEAAKDKQASGRRYNYYSKDALKQTPSGDPPKCKDGLVQIPDTGKLREVAALIPSLKQMEDTLNESRICTMEYNQDRLTEDQFLKVTLNRKNPLLHPLLKWLCTSNRAYLRLLKEEERFPQINTPYQFVFANASPDKEMQFQQEKKRVKAHWKGSKPSTIQAWHGSGFGNWHSIMRLGLKNLSNTQWMSAGAAYGSGIYLSPNFSTSQGYSRGSGGWAKSQLGSNLTGMALCELINDPNLPKPNPHYVIQQEEWVMTRFFFIFHSGAGVKQNIKLPLEVPKPLKHLFDTL